MNLRHTAALLLLAGGLISIASNAQQLKRDTLTPTQVEQIRAAGIYPADRIKLYVKFLNERAEKIKSLAKRGHNINRTHELDEQLQDFTALLDELGSNLDQYSERKADLRPAMKPLSDASANWLQILRALAGEPGFDVSRKEAIETADDISGDATRIQNEQNAYFAEHKEDAGQQRAEPK
jgi:hypothetical protein